MANSREQIVRSARGAAAHLMSLLRTQRPVERFVDAYAAEFDRPELKANRVRYFELLDTIGRECLLAIVHRMHSALPKYLTSAGKRSLSIPGRRATESFNEEFVKTLAERQDWTPDELVEFRHDLRLYAQLASCPGPRGKRLRPAGGPFVDRCAFLLDPSMLDRARRATETFLVELESIADQILRGAFSGARAN